LRAASDREGVAGAVDRVRVPPPRRPPGEIQRPVEAARQLAGCWQALARMKVNSKKIGRRGCSFGAEGLHCLFASSNRMVN